MRFEKAIGTIGRCASIFSPSPLNTRGWCDSPKVSSSVTLPATSKLLAWQERRRKTTGLRLTKWYGITDAYALHAYKPMWPPQVFNISCSKLRHWGKPAGIPAGVVGKPHVSMQAISHRLTPLAIKRMARSWFLERRTAYPVKRAAINPLKIGLGTRTVPFRSYESVRPHKNVLCPECTAYLDF